MRPVFGKAVTVEWSKRDKYGRIVGKVQIDGTDASLEQIKAGQTWVYRRYVKELAAGDADAYEQTEDAARLQKLGLWGGQSALPPWEWRRKSLRTR